MSLLAMVMACRSPSDDGKPPDPSGDSAAPIPSGATGETGETGHTAETGSTGETGLPAPDCVDGTPVGPLWWKPCTELCPPAQLSATLTATEPLPCWTSLGHPCAGQPDEGGYNYALASSDHRAELILLPGYEGAFDAGWFTQAFGALTVSVALGQRPDGAPFVYTQRFEDPALFSFADGRVTASLLLEATTARLDLRSYDADCLYLDYYLDCICDYEGFFVPVEVTLDLPLSDPLSP